MEVLPIAVRTTAGVAGIWVLVAAVIVVAIKAWPLLRKMQLEADGSLRTDLLARIAALETANEKDRAACEERIERSEARYEEALREMKEEIKWLRHERNNMRAGFNAMLSMLKRPGADVPTIIAAVEEMVTRGDEVIAVEKAAMAKGAHQ